MASIDDLRREITRNLKLYSNQVGQTLDAAIVEQSKYGVKRLKEISPKNTGDYAKSWSVIRDKKKGFIIYNKDHYRLTHLLENGHALVNGGRTRPQKHISIVRDEIADRIADAIARGLGE